MNKIVYKQTISLLLLSSIMAYISLKDITTHNFLVVAIPYIVIIGNISILLIKRDTYSSILKYILLFLVSYFAMYKPSFASPYLYGSIVISFFTPKAKDKIIYIISTLTAFILPTLIPILSGKNPVNFLYALYISTMPLFITILIITIIKIIKKGKKTEAQLNLELQTQNKKLQEYASQIEELTLLDERNRVAQELHDSLGHYLMAISMHLDILEKVKNSPEKSKQIFDKTKLLVKDSIKELRLTVYELKDMRKSNIFSDSIKELTSNLSTLGEISFKTDIDTQIETFSPFIKDIIYKTIKESITNGLKHGKAKNFEITLKISSDIIFSIKNDGISSSEIIKSNGLKGIEDRLSLIRGTAKFKSSNGFTVLCTIPTKDNKDLK